MAALWTLVEHHNDKKLTNTVVFESENLDFSVVRTDQ